LHIGIDIIPITGREAGLQRYAQQLIWGLAKYDSQNQYTLFLNEKTFNLFNIEQDNFRAIRVKTPPKVHFFWEQIYLPFRTLFEDLDVLHFPVSAPPYFQLSSIKTIITVHDITFVLYPKTMTKMSRFYWNFFMGRGIKRSERIIADSKSTKKDLIDHYKVDEEKVEVIYPSFINSFSRSELLKVHSVKIKRKYKLPQNYILYVGTLEPRKNIENLLRGFHKAKIENELKHKLVIVGRKGWLFSGILKLVKELKLEEDVIFTGFVPDRDLPVIYSGAKLFVFPSLYEGFGYPPLEAMSYGTPVLVSNNSSLSEVVDDAGILVNPNSVDDIAQGILRVVNDKDLRKRLRNKGLNRVKEFPLKKMIGEILKVYMEVASENSHDCN